MLKLEGALCVQGDFQLRAEVTLAAPITAVLGPSGAGKSTLINMIAGFVPLAEGRVFWKDRDISDAAPGARPIATIFQDNNLFPHLSVARNLALALTKVRPSEDQNRQIKAALDRVGLQGMEARKPGNLSGGQQARVALARSVLQDADLLLLDEAFASLGPALKRDMLGLVAEIAGEASMQVIIITHDPADATLIADEGVVVADGQVTAPKVIKSLLANPPKSLKVYLGD